MLKTNILISVILTAIFSSTISAQKNQISGGDNFTLMVSNEGKLLTWGANDYGQLGVNLQNQALQQSYSNTPITQPLINIKEVSAGKGNHALALNCEGQVYAWGRNNNGQLGNGTLGTDFNTNSIPTFVKRGEQVATVTSTDPSGLYLNNIESISSGSDVSYAIEKGTGKVLGWGRADGGMFGTANFGASTLTKDVYIKTPVYVKRENGAFLTNIVQIEVASGFCFALDKFGVVWSWGDTDYSKLGRPLTNNNNTPKPVLIDSVFTGNSSSTNSVKVNLSNIIKIAVGIDHCLALSKDGKVYSWGGDWASGQIGQGNNYQLSSDKAGRVVGIGVTSETGPFIGSDGTFAVDIAATMTSSAILLGDGRVITFGSNGNMNFSINRTIDSPIGYSLTCAINSASLPAGVLGVGICNNSTSCEPVSVSNSTEFPILVKTNSTSTLSNIASLSSGANTYFAKADDGTVYAWGFNRRGEIGNGTYTDNCYASSTGLSGLIEKSTFYCARKPNLGEDLKVCPTDINVKLSSKNVSNTLSYTYKWYKDGQVIPDSVKSSLIARNFGTYILEISDSRANVQAKCGICESQRDTIVVSELANPYTSTGCSNDIIASFEVNTPVNSKIKWYKNTSTATALNADSSSYITIAKSQTSISNYCGGSPILYAKDVSSYLGVLRPIAPTVTNSDNQGNSYLQIEVTQDITLKELSVLIQNQSNSQELNLIVEIFEHTTVNPSPSFQCFSCNSFDRFGPKATPIYTSTPLVFNASGDMNSMFSPVQIPLNKVLAPGSYWIRARLTKGYGILGFSGTPTLNNTMPVKWSVVENSDTKGLKAILAGRYGNIEGRGNVYNIKFSTGTAYECPLIPVCAKQICYAPEIEITGNGKVIKDGNGIQNLSNDNNTVFDPSPIFQSTEKEFYIKNRGNSPLNVTSVYVNGEGYSILKGFAGNLSPGDSAKIVVKFILNTSGSRFSGLIVESNDEDEAIYNFTIAASSFATELVVSSNENNIISEKTALDVSDNTLFGATSIANSIDKKFYLSDLDTDPNNLFIYNIEIVPNSKFKVTHSPSSPTQIGDNFIISYSSNTIGNDTATVRVFANDENSPYTFKIGAKTIATVDTTVCDGQSLKIGDYILTKKGQFALKTFKNTSYGDSTVKYNLAQIKQYPLSTFTIDGDLLKADATNSSYQWFTCNNGISNKINGATKATYIGTDKTNYLLETTKDECVSVSACRLLLVTSIENETALSGFNVFPSPSNTLLHIESINNQSSVNHFVITNLEGKIVFEEVEKFSSKTIETSGFSAGIYLLQIIDEKNKVSIYKVEITE